ncbi:MAG: hypothetical protein A3G41_06885 [Elusimicrobia bacterium RIFCSPLOWO2_12_FULL_59_9]|nr:MAG: hypothetical protein A3G41_06885 [Elusimicrobia bacterium RIFCSPLOWO2_12_FULL_59_9]
MSKKSEPSPEHMDDEIERLEAKFKEVAEDLGRLRQKLKTATKERIHEIKDEWAGLSYRWFVIILGGILVFFIFSFFYYTVVGQYADARVLPASTDPFLDILPVVDMTPVLSWGWFIAHLAAIFISLSYYPRRTPFMLLTFGLLIAIRTTFIILSPIGAPHGMLDMSRIDYIFSRLTGVLTFTNEFVFSAHTAIPFLFSLMFDIGWQKKLFLGVSIVMAACVLLTRNHYTVDVLAAYFMAYSIYRLSHYIFRRLTASKESNA